MKKTFIIITLCLTSISLYSQNNSFRFQAEATGAFGVGELPRVSGGANIMFASQLTPYTLIGLGAGFSYEQSPWGSVYLDKLDIPVEPVAYHAPIFVSISFNDTYRKVSPVFRLDVGYSFDLSSPNGVFDELNKYIDTNNPKLSAKTSGVFFEPHLGLEFKDRYNHSFYILVSAPLHLRQIREVTPSRTTLKIQEETGLVSSVGFKMGYRI